MPGLVGRGARLVEVDVLLALEGEGCLGLLLHVVLVKLLVELLSLVLDMLPLLFDSIAQVGNHRVVAELAGVRTVEISNVASVK